MFVYAVFRISLSVSCISAYTAEGGHARGRLVQNMKKVLQANLTYKEKILERLDTAAAGTCEMMQQEYVTIINEINCLAIIIHPFIHTCIANVPTPPDPPTIKILQKGSRDMCHQCVYYTISAIFIVRILVRNTHYCVRFTCVKQHRGCASPRH